MRGAHRPAAESDRPAAEPCEPEVIDSGAHPDDVGDGVPRPDLVEVHLLRVDAVRAALRGRERAEHRQRRRAHRLGQVGAREHRADGRPVAVVLVLDEHDHVQLRRAQAGAADLAELQPDRVGQHRLDGGDHRLQARAGVQQGGEQHVAGQAVAGVDPC